MSLNCGIVGLPNVGKSTLFNALTKSSQAQSENYPFCTITPNIAKVVVPDQRLSVLANLVNSTNIVPHMVEICDIAGLVEGASKGAGKGNLFLSHIRDVDTIIHVVRCFDGINGPNSIQHVMESIDPIRDIEIVEHELLLSDAQSIEKQIGKAKDKKYKSFLEEILNQLMTGIQARDIVINSNNFNIENLQLITYKPILYVCNVSEEHISSGNEYCNLVQQYAQNNGHRTIILSVKLESDIANDNDDQQELMDLFGMKEPGMNLLIRASYSLLGSITFFTAGQKEVRAWSIPNGTTASDAAGVIHTDFQKKFIKARVISYDDYIRYHGESGAQKVGKAKDEGRDYIVKDGDVILFKHG
ncbi:MAG: putative GTP-binding protein [Candidatus Xenolissoclinum pacificiensis L6]|uniref:GTP-binding protein n=1 Tax=Candidatus Xenolissoclinum pacificiensis L6 TaxID=1401685 RepID=W2V1E3_9RICK|nr:MAG: putative GTP-binding protein [Candidatus Xenolissoclinum pacificiensis L6]